MKINKSGKFIICSLFITALLFAGTLIFYIKGLPYIVSNQKSVQYVQNAVKKYLNADLTVQNPVLITGFSSDISFKTEKILLEKESKKLLDLDNLSTELSFKKIFSKTIVIKKLAAESIYADVNEMEKLFLAQKEEKQQKKPANDWEVDIYNALLGVRNCELMYSVNPDVKIHLKGKHIGVNNAEKIKKNVYFQLFAEVFRKEKKITLELNDNGNVFFKDELFHIENSPLKINNSNIFINLSADKKQNMDITLFSKNLNINDILDFLNTQIIENNVQKDVLVYFNDIQGTLDFNLNIKNDKLNGKFKIDKVKFKIKDVDNVPITITQGNIDLTPDKVTLKGFEGFYDNNEKNKLDFEGTIKDYFKSIDMEVVGNALVRNDFLKKHLSKMVGTRLEIKGEAPTRIDFKSKNNIMDFVWFFRLKPGENIKFGNDYLPFENTLRLMKSDMHLENMILDIKSLDYHMIEEDKLPDKQKIKDEKAKGNKPQPIFRLTSSIDILHDNFVKYIGFEIPKPLSSELLNPVLKQKLFKKGSISGKLTVDNGGKVPVIKGKMTMSKVLIPSQRTFIKEAVLEAENNLIHLNSKGGYRRSKFNFNGNIANEIKFPVIIKDVNLSLENIDLLKVLEVFNNQSEDNAIATDEGIVNIENTENDFDIRNIIIEKGHFHLDKGTYKDIQFGNLDADLTLNKDGVLNIKSNRFDFAQGRSSLSSSFDLINKKYNVKLGVKDVNSDTLATALLDLKREITGKASGFLDLSTDDSMKLSGIIKFRVFDGTIEKIGLVEYVMKCASILRNTFSMISPAIFADIVNVPEGNFDKITGTLKLNNNVATGINIKTYSSQLSTYIAGRYNIDNGDTSLRVYTKFSGVNKGFAGVLRKISLNSLSNRIPLNSRNDVNYYAVELAELPDIEADEKDCQIFLTKIEGDVVNNNYISSLKKIK